MSADVPGAVAHVREALRQHQASLNPWGNECDTCLRFQRWDDVEMYEWPCPTAAALAAALVALGAV